MPSRITVEKPSRLNVTDVGAGPQVDDVVAPFAVGHHRADLLDQRRTGRFDGHARHRQAGRISDHTGDAGRLLGRRIGRHREKERQNAYDNAQSDPD